jgi:hypothetical protein
MPERESDFIQTLPNKLKFGGPHNCQPTGKGVLPGGDASLGMQSIHEPSAALAAQPHARNLVARDGDEWRDVTASFSEILVPIAEFLRRPTLR